MDFSTKYILLTHLPLLQGLGGKELAQIENSIELDVEEMPSMQQPLINQGENCNHLIFLVEGRLRREQKSEDNTYAVTSYVNAPTVIEPYSLYGIDCCYKSTYYVDEDIRFISIRKSDVGAVLMKHEIFRINLLNALSSYIHRTRVMLYPIMHNTLGDKLLNFLKICTTECSVWASIKIKMTEIAKYIGETRLNVSHELRILEKQGIIELSRNKIIIPDINKL